jgi:capsular polysaccharide biosynthesis protein
MTSLHSIGGALRRRHRLVWLPALAGVAAAGLLAAFLPPSYQATALLALDEQQEAGLGFDLALQADQYLTQRYVAMATSQPVLRRACLDAGHGCDLAALAGQVSAQATRTAGVIAVSATAGTAAQAARLANAVAQEVVAQNRAQAVASLTPTRDYLRGQLDQLSRQQEALEQRAGQLVSASAAAPVLAQLASVQQQYQTTYGKLQDLEVQQARLSAALLVRQAAEPPAGPASPDLPRYVLVAAALGLTAGFLAALLADRLDGRVRDGADLAHATGAPVVLEAGRRTPAGEWCALLVQAGDRRDLLVVAASVEDDVEEAREALAGAAAELGRTPRVAGGGPPATDPRTLLQARVADGGVIVASRGRTSAGDARRTAELLRRAGLEIVAAVLVPDGREAVLSWRSLRRRLAGDQVLALPR